MNKLIKKNGSLVISLDFELLWGVFDKVEWTDKVEYFRNTRKVIPEILSLFEEYHISCTWACVGMLFNSGWDEWNANLPDRLPEYENEALSSYRYGKAVQSPKNEELCFAPDLISLIKNSRNQSIGTHTYSHYYLKEKGQRLEDFEADLQTATRLAADLDIEMSSIVFPRNQVNEEYLSCCNRNGIKIARSNPDTWYWRATEKDSLMQKIFRSGDAYLGTKDKSYQQAKIKENSNVVLQPASRFFRPVSGNTLLDRMRLKRIVDEIYQAAKNGEVYHLWWHPHNFGNSPSKSLNELRHILQHFTTCKHKYGFQSQSMESLNDLMVNA
ncbi:polysaccharide deacetylase family protein [Gramella sp. GC03-9]|uniref:Polysaccharide deacetylase family protein n=1 Tax=Christiangramia oceanisediminis TaxID=2920386 RepID=A0A9X2KW66_9FLAO|nr:polysaccharide deacetylase family protein [Gramella oceanisediminis]MCP9199902.1 polysaccharide deacetylase family protein [Gramella oceanisediminis]